MNKPVFTFTNDPDTGIFMDGASQIQFVVSGRVGNIHAQFSSEMRRILRKVLRWLP